MNDKQILEIKRLLKKSGKNFTIKILKSRQKEQQKFYNDLSFSKSETSLPEMEINDLIKENFFVYMSEKEGKITLTPKALLMLKYNITNPDNNTEMMFDEINNVFFNNIIKLSTKNLTSKEKAIIIGLIGIGALANQYSLNALELENERAEKWKTVIEHASRFIKGLGSEYNDGKLDNLWSNKIAGENEVRTEMRRLDSICTSTEGLYKKTGNNKYYIDMLRDNKIDENKISYLLRKIFDKKKPTYNDRKNLIATLGEIRKYDFHFFREESPFDLFEVRREIVRAIESFN